MAQLVWRLATGWTVRGSNPGEVRFSTLFQTGCEVHSTSYTKGTGSFPRVKRPKHGVDHQPHLARRLKKEYSYTSTSPQDLMARYRVNFTVTLSKLSARHKYLLEFPSTYRVNWRKCGCVESEVKVSAVKGVNRGVPWRVFTGGEVKWSAVKGSKSRRIVKGIYWWWSEVKVLLKLVCYTCGVTISETRYSTLHCVASPMVIAVNCSWSFMYCVIILCVSLLPHVYCFTVFVLLSYII